MGIDSAATANVDASTTLQCIGDVLFLFDAPCLLFVLFLMLLCLSVVDMVYRVSGLPDAADRPSPDATNRMQRFLPHRVATLRVP